MRVGHVRLARADRDRLRGGRGAEAAAARSTHARDARRPAAAAAAAGRRQPVHRLRRRRLLLPRQPRPRGDPDHVAARLRGGADRERLRDRTRLRPLDRRAAGRQDHLGAAGLERAAVVRVDERGGRDRRPEDRRGPRAAAGGEDRQLVRGRGHRRGLHRQRRRALPAHGGRGRAAHDGVAQALRQLGRAEAGAVERRFGHHADADGRRPGRHHRQRGPDERARLPARLGRADLPAAGLREGRERDRPVADRHRPLARGREQLRLLGPARDPGRQDDLTGARARRPRRRRRLPHGLALGGARAVGGAEAVGPQRPRLHVHQGPAALERRRLVPHRARLRLRQDRVQAPRRRGAGLQQQLRAGHARPGRDGLRRDARRSGGAARQDAAAGSPARLGRKARRSCGGSGCTYGGWVASARGCG